MEVRRASEVSRRASGIGVREFFNFEGVMVEECRIVDDDDDDDDVGLLLLLVRRAFVIAAISDAVGIDRNLESLPREGVERDDDE